MRAARSRVVASYLPGRTAIERTSAGAATEPSSEARSFTLRRLQLSQAALARGRLRRICSGKSPSARRKEALIVEACSVGKEVYKLLALQVATTIRVTCVYVQLAIRDVIAAILTMCA